MREIKVSYDNTIKILDEAKESLSKESQFTPQEIESLTENINATIECIHKTWGQ